jgi:transaldolase
MSIQTISSLDQLKNFTIVVADTSDFELIDQYKPHDATTNPSLILKASQNPKYEDLIQNAISYAKEKDPNNYTELALLKLFVNFGLKILELIPGRVSIEVDATYSYDTQKSIEIARKIIALFEKNNISRERILIKLATTYECAEACKVLEAEGIHCNMTLLFSLPQAIIAANANATLISPFVGRILDWHKLNYKIEYDAHEDPGVLSVTKIYQYYKKHGIKTQIMGASFRNIDEIIELAGCDLLTISPDLLKQLQNKNIEIVKKLDPEASKKMDIQKIELDKTGYNQMLLKDKMANEKLSQGIEFFTNDLQKIKDLLD